jgi:hypothetical protein
MKKFIKNHKWSLLFIIPGSIAGLLYWNYIGCNSGSCPITSIWYNSTVYGAILGFALGSIIDDQKKKKEPVTANKDQNK